MNTYRKPINSAHRKLLLQCSLLTLQRYVSLLAYPMDWSQNSISLLPKANTEDEKNTNSQTSSDFVVS